MVRVVGLGLVLPVPVHTTIIIRMHAHSRAHDIMMQAQN